MLVGDLAPGEGGHLHRAGARRRAGVRGTPASTGSACTPSAPAPDGRDLEADGRARTFIPFVPKSAGPPADGAAVRRTPRARPGPPGCRRQPQRSHPLGAPDRAGGSPVPARRLRRRRPAPCPHLGGRPGGARRAEGLRPGQPPALAGSRPPRRSGDDDQKPDSQPVAEPVTEDRSRRTERAAARPGEPRAEHAAAHHPLAPGTRPGVRRPRRRLARPARTQPAAHVPRSSPPAA